jgi:uncharacterized membrane protein
MNKIHYLIFSTLFFVFGCSNHSEDDLTTPLTSNTTKYIQNIKPIIDNNCVACHGATPSAGAQTSLVTYNQVKTSVQNNGLIDRISRAQGASGMMPYQGTRLPQSSIDLIIDWNTDGLLE